MTIELLSYQNIQLSIMEWKPPQLDVSYPPDLVLTNKLDVDPDFADNFARCARWYAFQSIALSTTQTSKH